MAFEVTTYTDVVAGEAVDGVDGFNFQSVSPGVTGVDQQNIRQSLLHRVVPSWALEHDPLTHPPTCAYVVRDGRFYLSRGTSTGDTHSGRPGNQITQTIITSDPDDLVPYRPAQLYGATGWTLAKAAGPSSDAWVTPLEVGPEFELAALESLVTSDDWAVSVLPHYLTMIDAAVAPEPTKVVLIHHDLDVVMRWIALGTLFVDADTARALQFRALVDDPWRADANIVGVSPQFGSSEFSGANVLDLAQRSSPRIEPSESARVRASWFLEQGIDDALNAVDIARRWEPVLGADLARDAARVVALPDAEIPGASGWQTTMATTERLALAGLRDDLALYAEELGEAAVGYGPTSADEFRIAGRAIRSAHELGVDELASGILVPTLEALTAVPPSIAGFARELAASPDPVRWDSAESREAAGAFVAELLSSAPADALSETFALARVVAAPVPDPVLDRAGARLAAVWARTPALGRESWRYWLAGHAVVAATVQALVQSFQAGDDAALRDLLRGEWDFIGSHAGDDVLHGWLTAAQLAQVPLGDRDQKIALTSPLPVAAWRVALAGSSVPGHARLWGTWIVHHGLSADMAATLKARIQDVRAADPRLGGSVPPGDWYPLMDGLSRSPDPELADFAAEYSRARSALRRARDEGAARSEARSAVLDLGRLGPFLLPELGRLLATSTSDEAGKLLDASSPWGPAAIRAFLLDLVARKHGLRAIEHALSLRTDPDERVATAADDALADVLEARPELVGRAQAEPRLRSEMDKYLRQRSRLHGGRRRLGGPFGRNKEA